MGTFQKHLQAIARGEVTKSNVIGLRKALFASERTRRGYSVGRTCPKVDFHDLDEAFALVGRINPRVVGELHDSGLKVLRDRRNRRKVEEFADLIEWPDHFELIGFTWLARDYAVPVYRLVGQGGGTMKFYNVPWQAHYMGLETGLYVLRRGDLW